VIFAIIQGLARVFLVFGFVVYFVSPTWDWLGGDGWAITERAYYRGTVSSVLMLIYEIRRYWRTLPNKSLNRR
jgi:hypothetical protein